MKEHLVKRKELLEEIRPLLPIKNDDHFYFRSGTITKIEDQFIMSVKSEVSFFDGEILAEMYRRLLEKIRCDQFYLSAPRGRLIAKYGRHGQLRFNTSAHNDFSDIDLWNSKIKWRSCPDDLIEAFRVVAKTAGEEIIDEDESWSLEDFEAYQKEAPELEMELTRSIRLRPPPFDPRGKAGIHVSGRYVGAFDDNKASRNRLQSPVPFEMVFPAKLLQQTLTKRKEKLRAVGKYNLQYYGDIEKGVIFDFGNIRLWIPEHPSENLAAIINRFFVVKPDHLVVVPDSFKKVISGTRLRKSEFYSPGSIATLKFEKNKIFYKLESEKGTSEDECSIKSIGPSLSHRLSVNPLDLANVFKGECLMGYVITRRKNNIRSNCLYLKDQRAEHLIQILNTN